MGTIVVFENVSLDGVTQDPTGEEGFSERDWRDILSPGDREAWAKMVLDDALGAQAILLGRRGYEYFATRYPSRTGALADQVNTLPKYVVSSTLTDPDWPATVLRGDVVAAVSRLRDTIDGELRVYASTRLVHTLLEHELVDEVRLAVFPLVMGAGDRVFPARNTQRPLRLVDNRTIGDALVHLTYAAR